MCDDQVLLPRPAVQFQTPCGHAIDATASEVSARKVSAHQSDSFEVRPAEVRPAEVRVLQVCPAEVRFAKLRPAEVRPAEVRPEEVRPPEVRPAELRHAEVRRAEVGPAEVRTDIAVLLTPGVPGGHALIEYRELLVVRHRIIQGREAVRSVTIAAAAGQRPALICACPTNVRSAPDAGGEGDVPDDGRVR